MPKKEENLELVIVDYPRNFLYWKLNYKQRWSSSAFPSVPNMFVKVVGIPAIFDDSQLLAGYHWHFYAYPMILSVDATWLFEFEKQTHTRTSTYAGDNLQYNISTDWNILKCAYDFLKCMLCLAYPTIIIIKIKIQEFFWNTWPQRTILFQRGLFWLNPLQF